MIKDIFIENLNRIKVWQEGKQKEEKVVFSTLDLLKQAIEQANEIVLFAHENPDGDAIGSLVATSLALKLLNKNVKVYVKHVPKTYTFLKETQNFVYELEDKAYDLAIALDTADLNRVEGKEYFKKAKKTILVDHHISNQMFADICFVDPRSPATCQILASIFEYFNIELTSDISDALMTGIITDTGGFQYDSIQPETFEFAAQLLRNGVDISNIYKKSLMTMSCQMFELNRIAQDRLEFFEDGKITLTYTTIEDEKKVNAAPGDTEGIVGIGKNIEGVEISIYIRQIDENEYKISWRSNKKCDVSAIASKFQGGGHIKAAGAKLTGNYDTVKEKVLHETIRRLNSSK